MELDWQRIHSFLAVAEHGTLSAAARHLKLTQPTVGRHIADLEVRLGGALFARHPAGLTLNERGEALLPSAREMAAAADRFHLVATGSQSQVAGTVRLSASKIMSAEVLPPLLTGLLQAHPELAVELVVSDAVSNLLRREADMALRMTQPKQADLMVKSLGGYATGFYATQAYVAQHGPFGQLADLFGHLMVGYDEGTLLIEGAAQMGIALARDAFRLRCDDNVVQEACVRAGMGVGVFQCQLADKWPGMVRLLPNAPTPTLPLYLVCHKDLRHTPRVASVWAWLAQGLAPAIQA